MLLTYGQKWSKAETQRFCTVQCFERSGRTMWHVWHSGSPDASSMLPLAASVSAFSYSACDLPPIGTLPQSMSEAVTKQ